MCECLVQVFHCFPNGLCVVYFLLSDVQPSQIGKIVLYCLFKVDVSFRTHYFLGDIIIIIYYYYFNFLENALHIRHSAMYRNSKKNMQNLKIHIASGRVKNTQSCGEINVQQSKKRITDNTY